MRHTLIALAALALVVPAAAQEPTPLVPGVAVADSVASEQVDTFTVALEAGRFVLGEVDQQTVDVVLAVYGPDDARLVRVDFSARGPETFQFDAETPGRYRIEVSPFEEQSGRYSIVLRRAEPIAGDPAARVDQVMASYDNGRTPGGVIGVVRDGELIFSRAYGMAELAWGIPFDTLTRNNIGSTSKQFTAFAILLLAERGELSLDDDVRIHIPELPDFGSAVTLRHLLTHTSGYREFANAFSLAGLRLDEGDHIARDEILELIERQPELQNEPGAEWNYNNSGFSLLTVVVERVTGTPFPEWMDANVFDPLGMEHTVIRSHPGAVVSRSAQGYMPAGEDSEATWREAEDLGGSMGAGGIYATVGDLARWIANFRGPVVGGPEAFDRMTTRYVLTDGDTTDYGLGLFVDRYRGLKRVHHGGADIAHRSMLIYYPGIDAGVIAESNNATFDAATIANDVARAFFGEQMEPAEGPADEAVGAETFDPESYDPESFDPLEGRYELEAAPGFVLRFFREGDTLWTQATGQDRARIEPTSDSTFRLLAVDAAVTFHRNPDGTADSLTLHQNGAHTAHKLDAEMWEPTIDELETLTGRYFSRELQTFYDVAVQDSTLTIDHRRFEDPVELTPADEPGSFTGTFPIGQAKFIRDDGGEVTALEVSNGRTRGVRFVPVELEAAASLPADPTRSILGSRARATLRSPSLGRQR
jgi:CubicO group peptidase (beta-lactamase class C family)